MTREQIMAAENGVSMQEEQKLIRVPMATFPPCAMVFSLNQNINKPSDQHNESDASKGFVPMSLITRVLTQRESRKTYPRMFLCMACKKDVFHEDKGCQVDLLPTTPRSVEITSRPTVERSQSFIHSLSPRNSMNSLRGGNNFNFSSKEYSTSTSLENDYWLGLETVSIINSLASKLDQYLLVSEYLNIWEQIKNWPSVVINLLHMSKLKSWSYKILCCFISLPCTYCFKPRKTAVNCNTYLNMALLNMKSNDWIF